MKALKDNIVVAEVAEQNQTAGGIILTQDLASGSKPAKVVAVGPDVEHVKEGDQIVIKWGEAVAFTEDRQQYAVLSEKHVYAIYG
jgi:co-chaperonin GroES (HSP10)